MAHCTCRSLVPFALLAGGLLAQAPAKPTPPLLGADLGLPNGMRATRLIRPRWDAEHARDTCKVFHHVFALDGTRLTKGNGGKFEHHKGLFIGWNQTGYAGKKFDFWHLHKGERQVFHGFTEPAGLSMPASAQVCRIDWIAPDGTVVIAEWRGLALVDVTEDHYVLHLRNRLTAPNGPVHLAGDPQHAGQQFRSPQSFAEQGAAPVQYVRPATAKAHGNDVWTGCDWIAAVQQHGERSFTIVRIEGRNNHGKAIWSTRPYGRFGATRELDVTAAKPVQLDQYYVIANGVRDAAFAAEQARRLRKRAPDKRNPDKQDQDK